MPTMQLSSEELCACTMNNELLTNEPNQTQQDALNQFTCYEYLCGEMQCNASGGVTEIPLAPRLEDTDEKETIDFFRPDVMDV